MARSSAKRASLDSHKYDNDDNKDDDNDDGDSSWNESLPEVQHDSKTKEQKMREEWEILGQEYEIATHARTSHGHLKRKVPRNQWKARTKQRKQLEKADEQAAALLTPGQSTQKRWRGSQKALEKQVIEDSKIFPTVAIARTQSKLTVKNRGDSDSASVDDEGDSDDDDDDDDDYKTDTQEGDDELEEKELDAFDDEDDKEYEGDDDLDEDMADDGGANEKSVKAKKKDQPDRTLKSKKRRIAPKDTKGRRLVRLRNFQSQRMARRHGDALAAHARGQPLKAIQLLKEVAKKAPSAPQVYSSLGMVYQDMLKACRTLHSGKDSASHTENSAGDLGPLGTSRGLQSMGMSDEAITDKEKSVPDPALAEHLDLAKKAYGSYHVAAILYKKDFSLWVRAADAGADVVDIIKEIALLPRLPSKVVAYHREEWKRWQSEILRDLHAADMLKPPGIDVPCKLAAIHIEVGNLSEALTILTDLKNRQDPSRPGRSEFQSSYKAWILYAELMLRVGHECILWNQGIKRNENYMFRRWLRKYSQVFDWRERRLQALGLALEAAAGTRSAAEFIVWLKNHARSTQSKERIGHDRKPQEDKETGFAEGESDRKLLLAKHTIEVQAFDKTTKDMDLDVNSEAARDRQADRDDLLKAQRVAVATLTSDYDESEKQPSSEQSDQILAEFGDTLPISGSCRQVCSIASELMKHLHGMELFQGARLVGDAVSSYFKQRAAKQDERRVAAHRIDEWQEKINQPSFLFATYQQEVSIL